MGALLGRGLSEGFSEGMGQKLRGRQQAEENRAIAEKFGVDLTGVTSPEERKIILQQALQGQTKENIFQERQKNFTDILLENESNEETPIENIENQNIDNIVSEKEPIKKSNPPLKNKRKSFTDKQIAQITIADPETGKALRAYEDSQRKSEENEYKKENDKIERETKRKEFFHNESKKYEEGLSEQSKAAEKKNRALERQMSNQENISNWDRLSSAIFQGSPFLDLVRSPNAQAFDANTLAQMEGQRQLLGGILSDSDIRLIMQKIVTASKSPEANRLIAEGQMFENKLYIEKDKIAREIKEKNGGYRPANFESQVDNIYNERFGNEIQKYYEKIMTLPDDPNRLKDMRRKVAPGSPINEKIIDMYLDMAKNNPELAKKWAQEDGYSIK